MFFTFHISTTVTFQIILKQYEEAEETHTVTHIHYYHIHTIILDCLDILLTALQRAMQRGLEESHICRWSVCLQTRCQMTVTVTFQVQHQLLFPRMALTHVETWGTWGGC